MLVTLILNADFFLYNPEVCADVVSGLVIIYGVLLATEPNSNTNEDIATRFYQEYVRCMSNEEEFLTQ
jgi:hypothetical protein